MATYEDKKIIGEMSDYIRRQYEEDDEAEKKWFEEMAKKNETKSED